MVTIFMFSYPLITGNIIYMQSKQNNRKNLHVPSLSFNSYKHPAVLKVIYISASFPLRIQ